MLYKPARRHDGDELEQESRAVTDSGLRHTSQLVSLNAAEFLPWESRKGARPDLYWVYDPFMINDEIFSLDF